MKLAEKPFWKALPHELFQGKIHPHLQLEILLLVIFNSGHLYHNVKFKVNLMKSCNEEEAGSVNSYHSVVESVPKMLQSAPSYFPRECGPPLPCSGSFPFNRICLSFSLATPVTSTLPTSVFPSIRTHLFLFKS